MGKIYVEAEGVIVTEPEKRTTSGGRIIYQARFGATERVKDKDTGAWKNGETIFFTLVDFNEVLGGFVKKDIVTVKGRVSLNKYTTKEGAEREELKIFMDEIQEVTRLPRTD